MVRRVRLPWCSSSQPLSRLAGTRLAIMSIAVSRSRSSHSVPWGRRYRTVDTRRGLVTSWWVEEPRGHSRPRLTGESGSPSTCTTFSSSTYTFCPQPTAQNGQIDLTTLSAVATRGCSSALARLFAAAPRAVRSPSVSCRTTGHDSSQVRISAASLVGMLLGLAGGGGPPHLRVRGHPPGDPVVHHLLGGRVLVGRVRQVLRAGQGSLAVLRLVRRVPAVGRRTGADQVRLPCRHTEAPADLRVVESLGDQSLDLLFTGQRHLRCAALPTHGRSMRNPVNHGAAARPRPRGRAPPT